MAGVSNSSSARLKQVLVLTLFLLSPLFVAPSKAQVALDSSSSAVPGSAVTLSWSHTVGTGANRALFVGIGKNSNPLPSVTGVTYGGVALTRVRGDDDLVNFNGTDIWCLLNPVSGAGTITVTFSNAGSAVDSYSGGAVSLSGVSGVETSNGAIGAASPASVPITTTTANDWLLCSLELNANNPPTPGAGQTIRWDVGQSVGRHTGATSGPLAAGSQTSSYTFLTTQWAMSVVAIKPVVASPHSVTLSWAASTTPSVTYNVYRATVTGGPYTQIAQALSTLSYVDNSVVAGTTYFYVATAVCGTDPSCAPSSESIFSNEASAVVPSP